jgi:dethiobiotin synthetase
MSIKLFITGTDTGVGKTYISVGILKAFNSLNKSTLGLKPVASGCQLIKGALYNEDALALQKASSIKLAYEKINPFAFEPAIAPHIAASKIKCPLNLASLNQSIHDGLTYPTDVCLIEGAGGFLTPLNHQETLADFVISHRFNVILVIGMRLGCLNQALLTVKAMQADKTSLIGWVANCLEPEMECLEENITTLESWLPTRCLGIVRYGQQPEETLNMSAIISQIFKSTPWHIEK